MAELFTIAWQAAIEQLPSADTDNGRPSRASSPALEQAVAADDPQGGQRADGDADQEADEYQHADHDRACHTTALTGTRLSKARLRQIQSATSGPVVGPAAADGVDLHQRTSADPATLAITTEGHLGLGAESAASGTRAVIRFGRFLAGPAASINRLDQVNRGVLERYLACLHTELAGRVVHRNMIGQLNMFLTAIRQHGWDDALPTNAMFFPEDFPKEAQWLPRALSEHVMAQLEHPATSPGGTTPATG